MKWHVLSGGRLRMRKGVYFPDAARDETIDLPVICHLLRHPQGNVLFDTGCHPDIAIDPLPRWGDKSKVLVPLQGPRDNVIDELALLGLGPLDIDLVVNSHLHTDHCGCNAFFAKATVVCHARELETARAELGPKIGMMPIDWDQPMPFDTFEGERDLFNDGRIVLLPMPGHTPGMSCALVSLDRTGSVLLTSDAVALRANLEQGVHPRQTWDHNAATRSMDEIRRIGERGATVIFGHDEQQWQGLQKGVAFYD
jgi:glyoxylase-like metal-dependent hydrolase (beta-lactamase superfamily II)